MAAGRVSRPFSYRITDLPTIDIDFFAKRGMPIYDSLRTQRNSATRRGPCYSRQTRLDWQLLRRHKGASNSSNQARTTA